MKNPKDITTAANSKTMNAIENVHLFAGSITQVTPLDFKTAAPEVDHSVNKANSKRIVKKSHKPLNENL